MTSAQSKVVRARYSSSGTPSSAVVDVDDEVPSAGDIVTVRVQVVDASGNGLPISGATVGLAIGGAAVATLAASTLTTNSVGRATTTLTVSSGAASGSRFYVYVSSVAFP